MRLYFVPLCSSFHCCYTRTQVPVSIGGQIDEPVHIFFAALYLMHVLADSIVIEFVTNFVNHQMHS